MENSGMNLGENIAQAYMKQYALPAGVNIPGVQDMIIEFAAGRKGSLYLELNQLIGDFAKKYHSNK